MWASDIWGIIFTSGGCRFYPKLPEYPKSEKKAPTSRRTKHLPPEKVDFSTFDQNILESFLAWMEKMRGCGINTRNQKLSNMLEAGILLPVIKNFLGHSSIAATMIYATVSDEHKNKYLREDGIAATLMAEERKDEPNYSNSSLDFLNRI